MGEPGDVSCPNRAGDKSNPQIAMHHPIWQRVDRLMIKLFRYFRLVGYQTVPEITISLHAGHHPTWLFVRPNRFFGGNQLLKAWIVADRIPIGLNAQQRRCNAGA